MFFDSLLHSLRELRGAPGMQLVVSERERIPFHIVCDDRRMVLRQLGEVELNDGQDLWRIVAQHGHVQLFPFDELFYQDGWVEAFEHLSDTHHELGKLPDHRLLLHPGAGILAGWLDDQWIAEAVPPGHFRSFQNPEMGCSYAVL